MRFARSNFEDKTVTAVAVAAHETAHALQDARGYVPLHLRQKPVRYGIVIERVGGARRVLRVAAFTGVAAALVSLIDEARWLRILKF